MAQLLRMPGTDVLPPGPRRNLVLELRVHLREANRPTLAVVTAAIAGLDGVKPVSRETVRRLFVGKTLANWPTLDSLLRALCQLGNQDPDRPRWSESEDRWTAIPTCREHLRLVWDRAVEEDATEEFPESPPSQPPPTPRAAPIPSPAQDDPWASSQPARGGWGATSKASAPTSGGYSDEPPF